MSSIQPIDAGDLIWDNDGCYLILRIVDEDGIIVYLWSSIEAGRPFVSEPRRASYGAFENYLLIGDATHLKRGNPSGDALDKKLCHRRPP